MSIFSYTSLTNQLPNTGSVQVTRTPNIFQGQEYSQEELQLLQNDSYTQNFSFITSSYYEITQINPGGSTQQLLGNVYYNGINPVIDPITDTVTSISVDPYNDYISNLDEGNGEQPPENIPYNVVLAYTFLNQEIGSPLQPLFISEISNDRTELELNSYILTYTDIIEQTLNFVGKRQVSTFFVDFQLNFGDNQFFSCVNIKLGDDVENPKVVVKLKEPLPYNVEKNDVLWITTFIGDTEFFTISYTPPPITIQDTQAIKGPNFNLPLKNHLNNSTNLLSFNDILSTPISSSYQQLNSLLERKDLNINIDYSNFHNFVHFSSAETRLINFHDKIILIEDYSASIATLNNTSTTSNLSQSKAVFESKIDSIITNFDAYEYFLYYDSGSSSWPKSNTTLPYQLYPVTGSQVINWIGNGNIDSPAYGGMLATASKFDYFNRDQLIKSIPDYLKEDTQNQPYEIFVDMVAQYYDSIWVYLKDVTNKYDNDNRLNFGVSKDLVADAIRDFGIKLYQNNFSNDDLFTAFLGLTPSGSLFPYPNMTGSLPAPKGFEYVDLLISASNNILPQEEVNKSLYKRIYHNLPYLLNSKGTIPGLRALITSFGIPDTILRINEYGGKDKINVDDWDHWQNEFNYAFNTLGSNFISSSWNLHSDWDSTSDVPETLMFRFKPEKLPKTNIPYSQSLWYGNGLNGVGITLKYTGSAYSSGSYSGSIKDPYYQYAHLDFYPDLSSSAKASVYLPFFNEKWWSVMVQWNGLDNWNLYVGDNLYERGENNTQIGFFESSSVIGNNASWISTSISYFPVSFSVNISGGYDIVTYDNTGIYDVAVSSTSSYIPFSGSYQEIRYYSTDISESVFRDYVMNPYSIEGNTLTSSPDDLAFRASIGGELYTSSISIHPKITGSWDITQSFNTGNSNFYYDSSPNFVTNEEYFFVDQPVAGIKNVIGDKIRLEDNVLPTGSTLSPFRSLLQQTNPSQSYTANINYLEVAFSPQNQINEDIMSQLGFFNIGDYIGDPRLRSSSADSYPDLDELRNEYFKKYFKQYNITDFIRFIKFFDNSLFKMLEDFVPARTSLASGLVIKQHLLERDKYPQPQVDINTTLAKYPKSGSIIYNQPLSQQNIIVSGTIKPQWNDYNNGTIQNFKGGTGGTFEKFNSLTTSPSGSTGLGPDNIFHLTQSWSESILTISGSVVTLHSTQEEFYNGELSGSKIVVTTQSLAQPYPKELKEFCYTPIQYFQTSSAEKSNNTFYNTAISTVTKPDNGEAYFISLQNQTQGVLNFQFQRFIKMSHFDANGENIEIPLEQVTKLKIYSTYATSIFGYPYYIEYDLIGNSNKGSYQFLEIQPKTLQLMNPGSPYLSGWHPDNVENYYVTASITNLSIPTDASGILNSYTTTVSASSYRGYSFDSGELDFGNTPNTQIQFSSSFFISSSGGDGRSYPVRLYRERNSIISYIAQGFYNSAAINTGSFYVETTPIQGDKYYIQLNIDDTSNTLNIDKLDFLVTQSRPVTSSACLGTILEPYVTVNNYYNSNFNPLINNVLDQRLNSFYQDVDYTTGIFTPVNFDLIISESAIKFPIPDSFYSQKSSIIPRYLGAKSTSQKLNVWQQGDTGTYGKEPTIDNLQTKIVYADWIGGYPPEHMNASGIHIQYIIDEDGSIKIPNTSPNSLEDVQQNFTAKSVLELNSNTIGTGEPTPFRNVIRGGYRIEPVLYTQSGSAPNAQWVSQIGLTDVIPNSGSATGNYLNNGSISGSTNLLENNKVTRRLQLNSSSTNSGFINTGTFNGLTYSYYQVPSGLIQENVYLTLWINNLTIIWADNSNISQKPSFTLGIILKKNNDTLAVIQRNITPNNSTHQQGGWSYEVNHANFVINPSTLSANDEISIELQADLTNGSWLNTGAFPEGISIFPASPGSYKFTQIPLPTTNIPAGNNDIWGFYNTSSHPNIITSSNAVFATLGDIYGDENAKQIDITGSGFNAVNLPWSIKTGDEFRFEGVEENVFMVKKAFGPNEGSGSRITPIGNIEVQFDKTLPINATINNFNLDHFLIRRYTPDSSQIIIEGFKPTNAVGPYIVKPKYITSELNKGIDDYILNLTNKGLI
tara:strand:+ start:8674 stop:14931 length:6258 start_codon:yes stop_codon:yes gene_type:complete